MPRTMNSMSMPLPHLAMGPSIQACISNLILENVKMHAAFMQLRLGRINPSRKGHHVSRQGASANFLRIRDAFLSWQSRQKTATGLVSMSLGSGPSAGKRAGVQTDQAKQEQPPAVDRFPVGLQSSKSQKPPNFGKL